MTESTEATTYTVRLPWPPSVNSYMVAKGNVRFASLAAKGFRREVVRIVGEAFGGLELSGRLAVHLELTPPDRRKRDIDNHVKPLADALEFAGLIVDDEQIDKWIVERLPAESPGCADVTIVELTP